MVVPLVGTWIEIKEQFARGHGEVVVPLVGTWIEILYSSYCPSSGSRAPRGHVD